MRGNETSRGEEKREEADQEAVALKERDSPGRKQEVKSSELHRANKKNVNKCFIK